ncbi:MAG: hypothetical protein KDA89_11720 [Planctomycetaceae bacterium]|nr:hypothetical protein [Planctomycetaceae bacterium]
MNRNITTVINTLLRTSQQSAETTADTRDLTDVVRRDPAMLNTLAPFLSDDDLRRITADVMGDDSGTATL